ncbi:MAG TPA: enoyl-CoA hydratase-related protein [Caldimonas sp.]|jgi:crotonobetainyl-CoA hydratase|nr:enoyl-CoA hydratase-related protein [Caldimonas sp.]HEV7575255.1 enoyl-CoA hydratase-related protein [Caldimonas sp.]
MASAEEPVLFEKTGQIAILTLNRPKVMNAVDRPMWLGAAEAIESFAADPALRVLIVTGAGDRSFCAGSDLKAKAAGELEVTEEMNRWGYAGIVRHFVAKPVIAAVNGYALGGGTEIALSCDLIVASEHATFGLPEASHGLLAGAGGLLRLPRQIPLKVAMNCILTGEPLSAAEALRWGLVNRVVPHARLMDAAIEMAMKICASSPRSISASKEIVYRGLDQSLDFPGDAWAMNDRYVDIVQASDDAHEGMRAFLEKRAPVWKE